MGPDLCILYEIIICVASSICYTQTMLKKLHHLPNKTNCISLLNNDRITNTYLCLSYEYFNIILVYHLSSFPVVAL